MLQQYKYNNEAAPHAQVPIAQQKDKKSNKTVKL